MEHRWGNRHEISSPVDLGTSGGIVARGRICNVSISGAFVESPLPVGLFSDIRVRFTTLLDGKRTTATVDGQVVRKNAIGFGIEWRELAPDALRPLVGRPSARNPREPPRLSLVQPTAAGILSGSHTD
jgi:hypothetical protein